MNLTETLSATSRLSNVAIDLIDVPNLVLLIMVGVIAYIGRKAQYREDFDFGNMLKDENGKESSLRLGVLICLGVSSWVVIKLTIAGDLPPEFFYAYLACWSGAKIFETAIAAFLRVKYGPPEPPKEKV